MIQATDLRSISPGRRVCHGPVCHGRCSWPDFYFDNHAVCVECRAWVAAHAKARNRPTIRVRPDHVTRLPEPIPSYARSERRQWRQPERAAPG